jgi:hypothetical protein
MLANLQEPLTEEEYAIKDPLQGPCPKTPKLVKLPVMQCGILSLSVQYSYFFCVGDV